MNKYDEIERFIQCGKCIDELPEGQSPQEYGQLEIGLSRTGLIVWCKRHNEFVTEFNFDKPMDELPECNDCGDPHEHRTH